MRTAREHGIDVALDRALNASADHPWLTEHPEWFNARPDGTLKYAENPPKKYQDIYNFNWDLRGLARALAGVLRDPALGRPGVKFFRVDNPHTKPFPFWEWLIEEIRNDDPDVVFLAEAFTRRKVMRELAKLGFTQSYTYFTWKNSRWELTEYVNELADSEEREYFRPNFFANTPDILHAYLVARRPGGVRHPAHPRRHAEPELRHLLRLRALRERAGPRRARRSTWTPRSTRSEQRALDGPMLPIIRPHERDPARAPRAAAAHQHPFLETENDGAGRVRQALRATTRSSSSSTSIRTHARRASWSVPSQLGLPPVFAVEDLFTGERFDWRIGAQLRAARPDVRADPRPPGASDDDRRHPQRPRPLVRGQPLWFKTARLLRDPPARRSSTATATVRRLPRPDREARLPAVARRRRHLAAADVRVAAARRRLRHRRLLHDPPRLRDGRRRPRLHRRRPPARHPRHRRPGHEPHVERPPVVPGVALERRTTPSATGTSGRTPYDRYQDARIIFTDTETSNWTWDDQARRLLLAPLLLPPAGPQLRQPRGPGRDARGPALLAGPRAWTASASTPSPYLYERDGHQLREPARDARLPQAGARAIDADYPDRVLLAEANRWPAGRRRVLRRRRRVPHGLPLPRHAAHVHVAAPRGGQRRSTRSSRQRPASRRTASGACSCATTTS